MSISPELREFVVDQLAPAGASARNMFGGVGVFCDGVMMGFLFEDRVYFKVDDENRPDYQAAGMEPLLYTPRGTVTNSYYEVPPEILEDTDEVLVWASRAVAAAARAKSGRSRGRRGGRRRP